MFLKKSLKPLIAAAAISAAVIASAIIYFQANRHTVYEDTFFSMDTVVSVRSDIDVCKDTRDIFKSLEAVYDCRSENGEAARLNESGGLENCSDELIRGLNNILNLNREYGSSVDITAGGLTLLWNIDSENPSVPSEKDIDAALETVGIDNIKVSGNSVTLQNGAKLDFGAVAKGIALDRVKAFLKDIDDSSDTIVSTGSSVLLYGDGENGYFNVDIKEPESGGVLGRVRTKPCFLSTSGGYERYFEADGKRYCHIMDTKTGYPSESDITTVTVFAGKGLLSDFISTQVFIEGTKGIEKHLNAQDYKIIAADKNKKLYVSPGLEFVKKDLSYEE